MKRFVLFFAWLSFVTLLQQCNSSANQEQLQQMQNQLNEAQAAVDSLQQASQKEAPMLHVVFFWLKEGISDADRAKFLEGARSLGQIETLRTFKIGPPAATTPRDVIDSSYDYALLTRFDDIAGHDVYQDHPVHLAFIESCQSYWTKVQVYDAMLE